jgi:hypothetical protein
MACLEGQDKCLSGLLVCQGRRKAPGEDWRVGDGSKIPKDVCAAAAATSETAIFAELPRWTAAPKYQGGIGQGVRWAAAGGVARRQFSTSGRTKAR